MQHHHTTARSGDKSPGARSPLFVIGLGHERDIFIENASMLISGGMPVAVALEAITADVRSRRMKKLVAGLAADVDAGLPLWQAMEKTKLFPSHVIALVRLGESSGKLAENLKVIAAEQNKGRVLRSKVYSAIMYPAFVLALTLIVGVALAWFILPKLAIVFSQINVALPLITRLLIAAGRFLADNGSSVILGAIAVAAVFIFIIIFFPGFRRLGQRALFFAPGIGRLIKEIELSRFGYLLAALLQAGVPIAQAIESLVKVSELPAYRSLFAYMRQGIEDGDSLQQIFSSFKNAKRLVPVSIQQLLVAGEQSGLLREALLKIGETFEVKADASAKNLTVVLEPALLVVVWLGVVAMALAVILPIYSLIGGFNSGV